MADLEQERVTALWREAARRLAPAFEPLPLDPTEDEYYAMGFRAERAEAECRRLREQLDAARQAAEWEDEHGGCECRTCLALGAALGVVGEQE